MLAGQSQPHASVSNEQERFVIRGDARFPCDSRASCVSVIKGAVCHAELGVVGFPRGNGA